jgi:hypothetical protein
LFAFTQPTKIYSKSIKHIKGSGIDYVNLNNYIADKFAWQTGYAAYSQLYELKEEEIKIIENA